MHFSQCDDPIAVIEGIASGQNRLVMRDAIAQQLNIFQALMDKFPVSPRVRKRCMKPTAYPKAHVLGMLEQVYPKAESEFRHDLPRPIANAGFRPLLWQAGLASKPTKARHRTRRPSHSLR